MWFLWLYFYSKKTYSNHKMSNNGHRSENWHDGFPDSLLSACLDVQGTGNLWPSAMVHSGRNSSLWISHMLWRTQQASTTSGTEAVAISSYFPRHLQLPLRRPPPSLLNSSRSWHFALAASVLGGWWNPSSASFWGGMQGLQWYVLGSRHHQQFWMAGRKMNS